MNKRLKEIRSREGLTLVQLAEKLSLTKDHVSRMELGKRPITKKNIDHICKTFNINPEWLITGEGRMYLSPVHDLDVPEDIKDIMEMICSFEDSDKEAVKIMITALYNKIKDK